LLFYESIGVNEIMVMLVKRRGEMEVEVKELEG